MEILTKFSIRAARRLAPGILAMALCLLHTSCPLFWIGSYANENASAGLTGDLVASARLPEEDFYMDNAYLGVASFPDSVIVVTKKHLYRYDADTLKLKATYLCSPVVADGTGFDGSGPFDLWNTAVQGSTFVMNRSSPTMNTTWLEFSFEGTLADGNPVPPSTIGVSPSTPTVPLAGGKFFYTPPSSSTSFTIGGQLQEFLGFGTSLCPQNEVGLMVMTESNEASGWLSAFGFGPMAVVNGRVKGAVDVYDVPLPITSAGSFLPRRIAVDLPYPGTDYGYEKVDGFRYVSGRDYDVAMIHTWGRMQFTILDHSGKILANLSGDEDDLRGFAPGKSGYYIFRGGGNDGGFPTPPSISYYRWP